LETTVYADVLFFVNFSMDFITLWISALLSSKPRKALRMTVAAAIGALYGVLSVLLHAGGVLSYLLCAAVSLLMAITAFGFSDGIRALIKQSALIWVCGALLGGVMTALLSVGGSIYVAETRGGNLLSVICALSVAAVYAAVRLICNTKNKRTATVTATWKGNTVTFTALCDSGNLMRDPISGDPVVPVSKDILIKLCGRVVIDALLTLDSDTLTAMNVSLRLIPHKSDSTSDIIGGLLPDSVTVSAGKEKSTVRCILCPRECKKDHYAGHGATLPTSLLP